DLIIIPFLNFSILAYAGFGQNFTRTALTDTEDIGQSDNASLVFWDVDPRYSCHNYPCLCLNLGFFLLITYNLPLRRTMMLSALLFLIDALTFIFSFVLLTDSQYRQFDLITIGNPRFCQVIWAHLELHLVARKQLDVVHSHFSG